MTLLHPILLTGAILLGLPILLHLIMRQQPRHVLFPAFRFLQQKQRINQRKIRLRHLLLLLLRMLLIALMCLALFQPRLLSDRFYLRAEQPLAAVLIVDTSPSMGYRVGETSRLEDARRRAAELLDELPSGSQLSILDTGDFDPLPVWARTEADAKRQLDALQTPKGANQPVTSVLDKAYRLLQVLDRESESPDQPPLPRFLAIFSDRTLPSWQSEQVPLLEEQRSRVPPPPINAVYVDVGVDKPINLAITDIQVETGFDDGYRAFADLAVTVRATGKAAENVLVCRLDGETGAERKAVSLPAGQSQVLTFRRTDLRPGLHQAEVSLLTPDSLLFDNVRYASLRIQDPRKILVVTDRPAAAQVWKWALDNSPDRLFRCDVEATKSVRDWPPERWTDYQAVCLLSVADPTGFWTPLERYLERGGSLVVLPGGDELDTEAYNSAPAQRILPGQLVAVQEAAELAKGTTWLWNSLDTSHPLLARFGDWERQGDVEFIYLRPRVYRYWQVRPGEKRWTIVSYNDADTHAALLERPVGAGRVMLFTTPMDARKDADGRLWNDYLETSFYFVWANETLKYLLGDLQPRPLNFPTGQPVRIPLPVSELSKSEQTYVLAGPGVVGSDALLSLAKDAEGKPSTRLTIERSRLTQAGNFLVHAPDGRWVDGFSLNVPNQESELTRQEAASIEQLLGPDSLIAPDQTVDLGSILDQRFDQPVDLFPWLMIMVLILFAVENLLANRFYRRPSATAATPER